MVASRIANRRRERRKRDASAQPASRTVLVGAVTALWVGVAMNAPFAGAQATFPSTAKAADVGSVDAVISAFYAVLSGPVGQPRDWPRFRSLFVPGARLFGAYPTRSGGAKVVAWSVESYVSSVGTMLTSTGFRERELGRRTDTFGNIAQAFSSFESERKMNSTRKVERGIHSFQLLRDGSRWWIVSVYGDNERPGNTIPEVYLNKQ